MSFGTKAGIHPLMEYQGGGTAVTIETVMIVMEWFEPALPLRAAPGCEPTEHREQADGGNHQDVGCRLGQGNRRGFDIP